jgi:hypothetical protein
VQSSDESNEFIPIKIVGEAVQIKEEGEPIAISFSSIKDEPEVSSHTFLQYLGLPSVVMPSCPLTFPHKSAPCGEWKLYVYIFIVC